MQHDAGDFFLGASDTLILCVWFKFIIIDVISWEYVVYYCIRFIYPNLFGLLVDSKRGHRETAEYLIDEMLRCLNILT